MGGIKGDTILINYIKSNLLCRQAAEPTTVKKTKNKKKGKTFVAYFFLNRNVATSYIFSPFVGYFRGVHNQRCGRKDR